VSFHCFQDEIKQVQNTVYKTAVPVNISVLNGNRQQFEYSVDVCVLLEGQAGDDCNLFFSCKAGLFDILLFKNCIQNVDT
jgi:hypothetical protein